MEEEKAQEESLKEEGQGQPEELEWDFGWKFHRGPILVAAILTVIFYLCVLIFVK